MQSSVLIATLLVATVILVTVYPSSGEPWIIGGLSCKPCTSPEDCNRNIDCEYGHTMDQCGRKICLKGPDETCGARRGKCSAGLFCNNCGFCTGCSQVTKKCGEQVCQYMSPNYLKK